MTYDPIDPDADGAYDTNELTVNTLNGLDLSANVDAPLRVDGQTVFSAGPEVADFGDLFAYYSARQESFSNNATLTTITDFSGNNRDLVAANSTNVTYNSSDINGLPSFETGGNAYFECDPFNLTTPATMVAVVDSDANSTNQAILNIGAYPDSAGSMSLSMDTGEFNDIIQYSWGGEFMYERSVSTTIPTTIIGIWDSPASNSTIRKDGVDLSPGQNQASTQHSISEIYAFARDGNSNNFDGSIAEMIVYNDTPNISQLENYLSNTFGTF
jgi:hypothetical protein